MNDDKTIFLKAATASPEIPANIKANLENVKGLRAFVFDQGLATMLQTQINMSTRNEAFINALRQRHAALQPYCGKTLIKGRIEIGIDAYWLYALPETETIVYWEYYRNYKDNT